MDSSAQGKMGFGANGRSATATPKFGKKLSGCMDCSYYAEVDMLGGRNCGGGDVVWGVRRQDDQEKLCRSQGSGRRSKLHHICVTVLRGRAAAPIDVIHFATNFNCIVMASKMSSGTAVSPAIVRRIQEGLLSQSQTLLFRIQSDRACPEVDI
jgi:hypothetical protein